MDGPSITQVFDSIIQLIRSVDFQFSEKEVIGKQSHPPPFSYPSKPSHLHTCADFPPPHPAPRKCSELQATINAIRDNSRLLDSVDFPLLLSITSHFIGIFPIVDSVSFTFNPPQFWPSFFFFFSYRNKLTRSSRCWLFFAHEIQTLLGRSSTTLACFLLLYQSQMNCLLLDLVHFYWHQILLLV